MDPPRTDLRPATPTPRDRTVSQELRAIAADVRGGRSARAGLLGVLALTLGVGGGFLLNSALLSRERSARLTAERALAAARGVHDAELLRARQAASVQSAALEQQLGDARKAAAESSAQRRILERKLVEELGAADRSGKARELELRQALIALREHQARQRSEIAALKSALARQRGQESFSTIARRYREGLFLVAVRTDRDRLIGLGTAFAVRNDGVLATNAHVVADAIKLRDRLARVGERASIVAVMNHHAGRVYRVVRHRLHPDYDPDLARSWDAALLVVETLGKPLPCSMPIAPRTQLAELAEGQAVCLLGFPGEVTDPRQPIATFKRGDVGRLTTLEGSSGPREKQVLVQHSAIATGGNSGSPLLDALGRVVALHTSGLSVRFSTDSREVVLRPSTGIHWALRADALWDLLLEERERD